MTDVKTRTRTLANSSRSLPMQGYLPAALFSAYPSQLNAWRDKYKIILLTGSSGGGKSRLAAEKINAYCIKYPKATCLMLRKTRESTANSIVAFMKQTVLEGVQNVNHLMSASRFEYANGSVLIYGGMKDEKQREHIRSIGGQGGVDMIWIEEASQFSEQDFNELLPRLRHNAADWRQIILTTNPDSPSHWIYQRLIVGGQAHVYTSSARDNPANPRDYLETLALLTGVQKQRLVDGLWVMGEGVVYDMFDANIHLVDSPPPNIVRYVVGVDWGFTNPGVMQVWGVDGDNRLCLIEETYRTGELVTGVNGGEGYWLLKAKEYQERYQPDKFICDPSEPAYIESFKRSGLNAIPANNKIRMGIDSMMARLKVVSVEDGGDGLPRMTFMRGACSEPDESLVRFKKPASTIDEITIYAWPKATDGRPVKEVPAKINDHCLIAGTMITTARGSVPIEQVMVGDCVLTRNGYKRVLASGMTNPNIETMTATFDNGIKLTGTGNHRVWIDGSGYIELQALRYGDKIITSDFYERHHQWQHRNVLHSMELYLGVIRNPKTGQIGFISRRIQAIRKKALAGCIKRFGSLFMEKSQQTMKSIIKIMIRSTMLSKILSVYQPPNIKNCISGSSPNGDVSSLESGWIKLDHLLLHGINRRKEGLGIKFWGPWRGKTENLFLWFVNNVDNLLKPLLSTAISSFVPIAVNPLIGASLAWTMRQDVANIAVPTLLSTSIQNNVIAPIHVVTVVKNENRSAVYDLTVEGAHEFFANGVLVHNSMDCARYVSLDTDSPQGVYFR